MWPFKKRVYREDFKHLIKLSTKDGMLSSDLCRKYFYIIQALLPDLNKDELRYMTRQQNCILQADAFKLLMEFDSKKA